MMELCRVESGGESVDTIRREIYSKGKYKWESKFLKLSKCFEGGQTVVKCSKIS